MKLSAKTLIKLVLLVFILVELKAVNKPEQSILVSTIITLNKSFKKLYQQILKQNSIQNSTKMKKISCE